MENRPNPINLFASGSNNIQAPSTERTTIGYPQSGVFPSREANYLFHMFSSMLSYIETSGIALWNKNLTYHKHYKTRGSDGFIYTSKTNNNKNDNPVLDTDGQNWQRDSLGYKEKAADSDKLDGLNSTNFLRSTGKAVDSSKLNGLVEKTDATANSIAKRDSNADLVARLFRSTYATQTTNMNASDALAFRVNDGTNNYIRYATYTVIKNWLVANGAKLTDTDTWRPVSDSVTSTSTTDAANSKAVKLAYDKAVEAFDKASAGFDAGKSFQANGYQKFSNGLIIQWGFVDMGSSSKKVTFPVTFPSACAVPICQIKRSQALIYAPVVTGYNKTDFTCYTGYAERDVFYLALGY